MVFLSNLLRNYWTVCHSGSGSFHSHHEHGRVPMSPWLRDFKVQAAKHEAPWGCPFSHPETDAHASLPDTQASTASAHVHSPIPQAGSLILWASSPVVILTLDVGRPGGPNPDSLLILCAPGKWPQFPHPHRANTRRKPEGISLKAGWRERRSNSDSQARSNKRKTNTSDFLKIGNSLVVQWLGLVTFTAGGPGSTPGWGTKIPQAAQWKIKK